MLRDIALFIRVESEKLHIHSLADVTEQLKGKSMKNEKILLHNGIIAVSYTHLTLPTTILV